MDGKRDTEGNTLQLAREHIDFERNVIGEHSPLWRYMHGTAEQVREVEALADEYAATLAAHWLGVDGRNADHINHSPGGSPNPLPPAAPAPRHERHLAASGFTTRPDLAERAPDGRITMAELRSRAYAAARQVTRGKQWAEEQRQDIASAVVENVLRRTHWTGTRHGTPGEVLAWIAFCERYPLEAARRERANIGTVPKDAASGLALMRLALNARDTVSVRNEASDNDDTFTEGVYVSGPGEQLRRQRDLLGTPRHARLTAVHMLADLDITTAWGPAFTVAYTAARGILARDEDGNLVETSGDDIAAELDMTHTAYRKAMSRGRKLIRDNVWSEDWTAASLHMIDPAAGNGAVHAASLGESEQWRTTPRTVADVTHKRTRKAPRKTPAAWTSKLPARSRNRLHAAATARQERCGVPVAQRTRATV